MTQDAPLDSAPTSREVIHADARTGVDPLEIEQCAWLAESFGAGIMLHGKGPKGSLRREATRVGCPTIVVEGGEVWKFEPSVLECMTRGVFNVLKRLEMLAGEPLIPDSQSIIRTTKWIRAERGGFLSMHVAPGDGDSCGRSRRLLKILGPRFVPFLLAFLRIPYPSPGLHAGVIAGGESD